MSNATRFWSKVDTTGECWEWTAAKDRYGYGKFWIDGKRKKAHRVAYELEVGEIPQGLELDHLCRNTACVRPDHLEAVTHKQNTLRGEGLSAQNARKTHCDSGHPFDDANTYVRRYGGRDCRTCNRERMRRRRQKAGSAT